MHLLRAKTKSLLVTWLFSYLSIILVLFLLMSIIIRVYEKALNDATDEFNNYVFGRVTSSVNEVLLNISNLHLTMVRNERLRNLLTEPIADYYLTQQTYDVIDDIKSYKQYMVNTDSLFVYLKDKDCVLSEQGILDSGTYFDIFFDKEKMSYEEWKTVLLNIQNSKYTNMYCKNGIESLAFIFPIPMDSSKSTGVILSNKQYLVKGIEKVEWKSLCDIFVYNTYGDLILSEKRSENDKDIPKTLLELKKYNNSKNTVHISDISVNRDNWKVVTVVEKNIIIQKVLFLHYFVGSSIFVCILLLSFLVKLFIRHNYHPIKVIMELLDVKDRKNEYEVLYNNITEMLKKNRTLLISSKKKDEELKANTLLKLLKGNLERSELSKYGVSFIGEYFSVLIFEIDNISNLFKEDTKLQDSERKQDLKFMLCNVFEELFGDRDVKIYVTEIDGLIVAILNFKSKPDLKQIKNVAVRGVEFINGHFDISLSFSLSEINTGVDSAAKSYEQALETIRYKKFLYIEEPMSFDEIPIGRADSYIFNGHKEKSIINSIKLGKAENAKSVVKNIFDCLEKDKSLSLEYIHFVILDVLSTITKASSEAFPKNFFFATEAEIIKSINNGEPLGSIYSKIINYLDDKCCRINADIKKSRLQKRVEEIKDYVNKNFTSPDINVTTISYHFDLAASYISKIFKENVGISLVDYINRLRMEKAHELINEGNYSISEISKIVGYSNERTFYRIFKKYNVS